MKQIGIYGGSFNPIHFGHLGLARYVLTHTPMDELWLMVTPNNPLKDPSVLPDFSLRYTNACKAVADSVTACPLPDGKRLIVSDFEEKLPSPNYTAQTLRLLSRTYNDVRFSLVVGEDNWHLFPKWREWEWIIAHYPIYIYPRHGENICPIDPALEQMGQIIYLSGAPYFDISSTMIRQAGKS